jgi:hypothetical protein
MLKRKYQSVLSLRILLKNKTPKKYVNCECAYICLVHQND